MRLFCRIFGHRRSRRRVRPFADQWRSRCKYCDTHLIRLATGEWQVAERRIFCTAARGASMALSLAQSNDLESHPRQSRPTASQPRGQFKPRQEARRHVRWNASKRELRIALNDDELEAGRQPLTFHASREVQIGIFIGRLDDDFGSQNG